MQIVVRNVSLACDFDGQEMDVRLNKGKWLHEGTLCFLTTSVPYDGPPSSISELTQIVISRKPRN